MTCILTLYRTNPSPRVLCDAGVFYEQGQTLPEFAQFLVREKIDSISLIPDTVVDTSIKILEEEKRR